MSNWRYGTSSKGKTFFIRQGMLASPFWVVSMTTNMNFSMLVIGHIYYPTLNQIILRSRLVRGNVYYLLLLDDNNLTLEMILTLDSISCHWNAVIVTKGVGSGIFIEMLIQHWLFRIRSKIKSIRQRSIFLENNLQYGDYFLFGEVKNNEFFSFTFLRKSIFCLS